MNETYQPITIDPLVLVDEYLEHRAWLEKENSTSSWSINGLNNAMVSAISSSYWMNKIYSSDISDAHKSCDIHIHDAGMLTGYCFDKTKEFLLSSGKKMSFEEAEKIGLKEADVLSINNENKIESKRAFNIGLKGYDDLYEIGLEDGTVLRGFTKWHEFRTKNRGFVRADELTEEDDIIEFHELKVRVKPNTLKIWKQNQPVYCMEVEDNHNFFISEENYFLCVKNCSGWNLNTLLEEGINNVGNQINSNPAKHMSSACQQIVNFFGIMSNEFAGAQAVNQFDTRLAPFVRKDKMTFAEVKQCIQGFLHNSNMPSRWSGQAPFSNITLDITVPEDIKENFPVIGGKKMPFQYKDLQEEINMLNMALFDCFLDGDSKGATFQYPIPTVNIQKSFDWNSEVVNKLFELDSKYGQFYFANFVNSDLDPSEARSLCCRLRLDLRELTKKHGSLFGSADSTGSIGVVTLNMPKIGYLSRNETELFQRIDALMGIAKKSLEKKRNKISSLFDQGLYPYAKRYLTAGFTNHFSTVGLVGMNELCRNYFRNTKKKDLGIATDQGKELTIKILKYMRNKLSDFQEETGNLYNLESTPAESTAYRFALHDKKKYPDIITAGTVQNPYYTNSSNLPVGYTTDLWAAVKFQSDIQKLYTGGTVHHIFADTNEASPEKVKSIIKNVIENSELPYITYSPNVRHCINGHGLIKENTEVCSICKAEALANYNKKIQELEEKKKKLNENR